jgi:hypothetical protein
MAFEGDVDFPVISMIIGGQESQAELHRVEESMHRGGLTLNRGPLGFSIIGNPQLSAADVINPIDTEDEIHHLHHVEVVSNKVDFASQWSRDTDSSLYDPRKGLSKEDRRAFQYIKDNTKLVDNQYEVRQPWKKEPPPLIDNRSVVFHRFKTLHKKFKKDNPYFNRYAQSFDKLVSRGHVEVVPKEELNVRNKHYVPHHAVQHCRKDLRIVFDTSLSVGGTCINDMMYSGPDLLNNLLGVLLRFRENQFPISADLSAFYLSVLIPEKDRDYFRFFWYEDPSDCNSSIVEYRFKCHLFGGISSQSCCVHALNSAIAEAVAGGVINTEEAEYIKKSFYADDFIGSFKTLHEAIHLMTILIRVLSNRRFHLTKFASSEGKFLQEIPTQLLHPDLSDLDLAEKYGSALGIKWAYDQDMFIYEPKLQIPEGSQFTKRSLLSAIASVFDPMGHLGFAMVPAKLVFQDVCRTKYTWDCKLSDEFQKKINKWVQNLRGIKQVRVPRIMVAIGADEVDLHIFVDASSTCFAAMAFLRSLVPQGRVVVRLVCSRNRLGPLKGISIPRMELNGALMGARLANLLR